VKTDLDTLATALYVKTDDLLKESPQLAPWRPKVGIAPRLNDAELVTLAVMQALLGYTSESRWLRHAHAHLGHLFPYLPRQPGYNKRLRAAAGLIATVIRVLAADTSLWTDDVWVVDSTPVECGRSRETVKRSDLAGWAEYGYCASHSRYFWGLRLHLIATLGGLPIGFALTGAKADERQVLLSLLAADPALVATRPGQMLIADKNYYGISFEATLAGAGLTLLRPARHGEPERPGTRFFKPLRQVIESINDTFKGQLDLERHGGHTPDGVIIRVLQRILALTAAIWHNDRSGRPVKRSLVAYDHSAPRGALSYPRFSREELGGRFLGLMAYLDPKGEGDNSMPGKQRPCPGVWNGALRDPRNMAKAGLPEPQSPAGLNRNLPERRLKPVPCPASAISGGRCILRDAERCPVRVFKEMSGEPKLRYHV
jgi:Transposase DDE domain